MKLMLTILSIITLVGCSHGPTRSNSLKDAQATTQSETRPDPVVARYTGGEIRLSEVDEVAKSAIGKLKQDLEKELVKLRTETVERMMIEHLLEKKMADMKLDREQLLEQEVVAKIPEPSDEEVRALYEANKEQMPDVSIEVLAPRIREHIKGQSIQAAIQDYISNLKKKNDVQVLIEPFRVPVDSSGPSKGPADAPVVIVEFADYECPYCSSASRNVELARQKYPEKVRVVFKDFPLGFHQNAIPAAVAARCAGKQSKYWEMHDKLFTRQQNLSGPELAGYAAEIGLDTKAFDGCMANPVHAQNVEADMAVGEAAGVDGTPAFFVNGILIGGAQPPEAFIELIEKELAIAARKSGAKAPSDTETAPAGEDK